MKKRLLMVSLVVALIMGAIFGTWVYALNVFDKSLDAVGFIEITDECTIVDLDINGVQMMKVKLEPNGTTQADLTYTVHLYFDGVDSYQQTTSWTASEITSVTRKTITFSGIDLSAVVSLKVEVTH